MSKKRKKKRNTRRNRKAPIHPQAKLKNIRSSRAQVLLGLTREEAKLDWTQWAPDLGGFVVARFRSLGIGKRSDLFLGPCYIATVGGDREGSMVTFSMILSHKQGGPEVFFGSLMLDKTLQEVGQALGLDDGRLTFGRAVALDSTNNPCAFFRCRVAPDKEHIIHETNERVIPFVGDLFIHDGSLEWDRIESEAQFRFMEADKVFVMRSGELEILKIERNIG